MSGRARDDAIREDANGGPRRRFEYRPVIDGLEHHGPGLALVCVSCNAWTAAARQGRWRRRSRSWMAHWCHEMWQLHRGHCRG